MKKVTFGAWQLEIQESEDKTVEVVKDDKRLILLDGHSYYLLFAELEDDSIIFQNIDNDLLVNLKTNENKVIISFKKEED